MTKTLKLLMAVVCAVILAIVLSFVHPFGNPREVDASSGHLLAGAQIPEPIRKLVERKCGDCHSYAVRWPLYSRVAPVSWLLDMNLSRWDTYSNQEKSELLARLAAKARSGEMPPARYTAVHADSKLLTEEQGALYEWARAERRRLRTETQQTKSGQ